MPDTRPKRTILIVEDDPFLLSMYVTKMELSEYGVLQAPDGKQALKLALEKAPDLILLDILLPEMDGFEVLKSLRENSKGKEIPVILLTNLGQKEEIEKGLALGACDYLIKAHFTPQEVMQKVEKVLSEGKKTA